jgi:hypothetical protein
MEGRDFVLDTLMVNHGNSRQYEKSLIASFLAREMAIVSNILYVIHCSVNGMRLVKQFYLFKEKKHTAFVFISYNLINTSAKTDSNTS